MSWKILIACLVGIALIVVGGRLRQRSLERRQRLPPDARDPRLSPAQETQGAPLEPPERSGDASERGAER